MDEIARMRNEKSIKTLIEGLKSRNMEGYYAKDKEEALSIAKKLLEESKTVANGGSVTLVETGILDEMKSGKYTYLDRKAGKTPEEAREIEKNIFDVDCYLGSCNAITQDGILINIDGNSNRVSSYAYGPKKVILVVGANKICKDVDSAMKRARNEAATKNTQRFDIKTPCKETGTCMNCKSADTICCQFLITRASRHKGRINVILVNENLGF